MSDRVRLMLEDGTVLAEGVEPLKHLPDVGPDAYEMRLKMPVYKCTSCGQLWGNFEDAGFCAYGIGNGQWSQLYCNRCPR